MRGCPLWTAARASAPLAFTGTLNKLTLHLKPVQLSLADPQAAAGKGQRNNQASE